jgi:peptidoglycan/LPS O-acetylase OafA/YrhL
MPQSKERMLGVDLLRTLAILGVVLVHTGVFNNGRFGVQLFFLVSGYLLADLKASDSREFLVRRAFRLFPLYILVLLVFYRDSYENFWQLMISILLLQNIFWGFSSFAGAWSISNEWLFSLLLPLIIRLKKNQLLGLILISWAGQFITSYLVKKWGGIDNPSIEENYELKTWLNTFNPLINLCFFLIGFAIKRGFIPVLKNRYVCITIVLIGNFVTFALGHGLLMIWPVLLYCMFCLFIDYETKSRPIIFLVGFVGKRTYGIFFFHFLLILPVQNISYLENLDGHDWVKELLVFSIVFVLSAIVSQISWVFIEQPAIRFSRVLTS